MGGLRLSALDGIDVCLPFVQRFLRRRGKDSIDNARDDSEGVVAVLKSSRAYEVAFMNTSMPGVNESEAMNKLRQHKVEYAATDNGMITLLLLVLYNHDWSRRQARLGRSYQACFTHIWLNRFDLKYSAND